VANLREEFRVGLDYVDSVTMRSGSSSGSTITAALKLR
jgi:hypothetical protein